MERERERERRKHKIEKEGGTSTHYIDYLFSCSVSVLLVAGFSQVHCRQRGKCPSIIQIHNGCGVVISVSFAVIVYASCDLLHSVNATVFQKKTYRWRLAEYPVPPTLSPLSLSLSLPPSILPSLTCRRRQ